MPHVTILTLDTTNMLSLAAVMDPLRAANRQAGKAHFTWDIATPRAAPITLTSGITLPANPIARVPSCDILITVAGFGLEAQAQPPLLASLRRLAKTAQWLLAVDGGPWLLAAAGLLHGQTATTHWEDLETFAERFPEVDVINARHARSGTILTSGGAAPALDMMLQFLSWELGEALAARVAGSFIHAAHPAAHDPQLRLPPKAPRNPLLAQAHKLMETHLEDPLTIADIANTLGISIRALQTRFQTALGTSPKAYYLKLRLEEAHRLLRDTSLPLRQIALRTGFATQPQFSRAYKAHMGHSPSAARQKT